MGEIGRGDGVAGVDAFEDAIVALDLRREMSVEEGCLGRKRNEGRVGDGVGEIRTNFRYESGGDGEAVQYGGDEGDGAAEGFGQHEIVLHQNVVAVVSHNQARCGLSIFSHFAVNWARQ